ncbi:MAG: 50S ribosomal protein L11 methyltransferase [Thermodesulfovibrionales bacterium]|nr:50S ribosomal protein L11 methyltransferase [Thermodesulfovibrionales bacterium]
MFNSYITTSMGYYEFKITVADESRDALLQKMSEIGCLGAIDNDNALIAYFPDSLGINAITETLNPFRKTLKESGLDDTILYEYVYIGERDWNESWKKKFRPIDIGENITILPPWEEPNNQRINLIIDPGMAFGTGHHETTKTCLTLIEKLSRELLQKERFLDFGTGTGILAIAALKLGFKHAVCVDIDPLAVDAARRNAKLNNIQNIDIKEGSISDIKGNFDFIAANLMSEILIQNAREITSRLKKSGFALLSGMIVVQENDVIKAMEEDGLCILEKSYYGRWVSLIAGWR